MRLTIDFSSGEISSLMTGFAHCLNAGRLSSLLLGAVASGMVWLRILPDCLLSNTSVWQATRPIRTLAYALLLGPRLYVTTYVLFNH